MSAAPELKATLTLPQTAFPMKANLPQNEPLRLARWASLRLYEELRKAGRGRPAYMLHDGPPYANGPIHLGHALNKGLKDFVVKSKTMAGFDAPYVPGYDCHGLPIEIKVDEHLGRKKLEMPAPAVLEACRAYAQKYVDLQTSQFERIGCFGRWNTPYKTMARDYEARTLEAFYGFLEKGFVYRGLKPVYWCIHDRTALAEAEVEYEMHTSPSVYVRYRLTSDPAAIHPALAGRQVSTIIWTTTPWTLPASMAVAFHPDFEYVALEAGDGADAQVYIVAAELAASVAAGCKLGATRELARFKGSHARPHHLPASLPRPQRPGRAGHLRHRRPGHRRRPHRALARRGRLLYRPALRPRPSPAASMPRATSTWTPTPGPTPRRPPLTGKRSGPPIPSSSPCSRSAARCWPAATWNTPTRTAGAATIRSSSAPPSSGSSAGNAGEISPTTRKQPSASWPLKRSTRWSGTRPGARSASPT